MIYKWYCHFIDKLLDWLFKTDVIKATPAYHVADDIVELMHAGFNNHFGELDTETGLSEIIYDNKRLQQNCPSVTKHSAEGESDL